MTTMFLAMYHPSIPSTSTSPVRVASQAVDDYAARGWLLVDPDAPPPAVNTPYYTSAAADSRFVRQTLLDAQAAALVPGSGATAVALRAALVPKWKPSTAYASGEFALNPSGQIVSANTAFTSGASYSSSNWTATGTGAQTNTAQTVSAPWTFSTMPEVHAQGGEGVITARTVTDGKTVGAWNVTHDGTAGDVFHTTTGPNSKTRTVTDLATTSGSAVVTSATAAFSTGDPIAGAGADPGSTITGTGIPAGATILSVQSATQATMSANATATATGVTAVIGSGNANGGILAMGVDHGGAGLIVVNKWKGVGINLRQRASVVSNSSYGMQVIQESATAEAVAFRVSAAQPTKAVAKFDITGGTVAAGTPMVTFGANSVGGSTVAGQIMADTGTIAWNRDITATALNSSVEPHVGAYDEVATYPTQAYLKAKTTSNAGLFIYRNATGSSSDPTAYHARIVIDTASGAELRFQLGNAATARGSETLNTLLRMSGPAAGGAGGIAFFNAQPVGQPLETAGLKASLVGLGLIAGGTARTVTDGVTNATTTVTSATAAFTAADVGKTVTGVGIPNLTTIASITDATTAVLSAAATTTATGVTLVIGGKPTPLQLDGGTLSAGPGNFTSNITVENNQGVRIKDAAGTARSVGFLNSTGVMQLSDNAVANTYVQGTQILITPGGVAKATFSAGGMALADGVPLVLGTTTGSKIGTSATQKIGFFAATPVVQPSGTPAAATDAATTQALVNSLRSSLVSLGLVA